MPMRIVVVDRYEVYRKLREYRERGYVCRAEEDGDWECVKPINELQLDIHVLVVRPS